MMRLRFSSLVCACLLLLLVSAHPVRAQEGIALASLSIELWPEFDRPATLVILDGQLESSVTLPVEVTVRIPAAAGAPHAVAVRNEAGGLLNTPYTTTLSGDDMVVALTADSSEFRVEYYDPALTIQEEAREYAFQWKADYAVGAVAVRVQQPYGARDLKLEAGFNPAGVGDFGLNYYTASLGQLAAGQSLTVSFSYAKSTSTLSVEAVGAAASSESAATPTSAPSTSLSPWLIAGPLAGLLMIAGGVVYYWRGLRPPGRKNIQRSAQKHRRQRPAEVRAARQIPGAPLSAADSRFCTQCSQPLMPGDRFCRSCGEKARA